MVSGKCGVKLLGVPVVQSKKGDKDKVGPKIADASVDLLVDWDCAEKVKSMVFDTTALNTCSITAACVSVQERLNKKLLWLPCRHHIGERILLHVFKSLDIEDTSGPRSPMFSKFQQNFKLFKHTKITLLSFPVIPPSLKQARNTTVKLCQDFLACKHNRGDYRELVVITLVYLKKTPHEFKKFQRPGAHNHTRWMCKLLYSFKMVLLSAQIQKLPQGSIFGDSPARTQLVKLTSFIQFVVFCYVPWWITASDAPSAPVNDLRLLKSISNYSALNFGVAEAAKKAFQRHLWYLTEELAPLAFFTHDVDESTKEELRVTLLNQKYMLPAAEISKLHGSGFGKLTFPDMNDLPQQNLSELFGRESWQFFHYLGY